MTVIPFNLTNKLSQQYCWDVMALTSFLVGALATIWLRDRWEPKCFFGIVLVAMSISAWRHRSGAAKQSSVNKHNAQNHVRAVRPSMLIEWARLSGLTLFAIAILFVICHWTGVVRAGEPLQIFDKSVAGWVSVKLPTIVAQQVMLQMLLLPVLLRLFRNVTVAVFTGALIFSLLHLPNPVLVVLTFVAGAVWFSSYFHARRLTPIVISHCVLAMTAAGWGGEYILNMRVGPKCAELFPRKVESDTGQMYEFPGCVVGIAERLVQQGDRLFLEGWAYDSIHQCSPTSLYLHVDGRLKKIQQVEFVRSPARRWKNAFQSGFVDDTCYSFTATIPLSSARTVVDDFVSADRRPREIRLFAANVNGNLAQLPCQGEIQPIENLKTGQAVVLFPVEIDGRINVLDHQQGQMQIKGWTADLQSHAIPKRMYVEVDGKALEIDMQAHRSHRPDIARSLQDPSLVQCGFEIPIGQVEVSSASQIRCFAIDEQQQLHPIYLTEQAKMRVAPAQ